VISSSDFNTATRRKKSNIFDQIFSAMIIFVQHFSSSSAASLYLKNKYLNKVFLGYLFIILMLMIGIVMGDKAIFTVSIDYISMLRIYTVFTHLTNTFL
jgi:hypothetical protein